VEEFGYSFHLFDDYPKVKRVFCPPKECFDPQANADSNMQTSAFILWPY